MGSKVGTSSATCTIYAKGIDVHVDNLALLAAETNWVLICIWHHSNKYTCIAGTTALWLAKGATL